MRIRKTTLNDLEPVMAMYDYARKFMQEHGNPNQWINGYPSEEPTDTATYARMSRERR